MISPESPYPDVDEAMAYLAGFQGLAPSPEPGNVREVMTGLHLARGMEQMKRAQLYKDGTNQSNANHSWRLGIIVTQIAGSQRDDIDPGSARVKCDIHDMKELWAGDTPIRDLALKASKMPREKAGKAIYIVNELSKNPYVRRRFEEYENLEGPDDRLVDAADKYEPLEFDIENDGTTYRVNEDHFPWLVQTQLPRMAIDATVLHLAVGALQEVGERWESDWNCQPFDGDHLEIIESTLTAIRTAGTPEYATAHRHLVTGTETPATSTSYRTH